MRWIALVLCALLFAGCASSPAAKTDDTAVKPAAAAGASAAAAAPNATAPLVLKKDGSWVGAYGAPPMVQNAPRGAAQGGDPYAVTMPAGVANVVVDFSYTTKPGICFTVNDGEPVCPTDLSDPTDMGPRHLQTTLVAPKAGPFSVAPYFTGPRAQGTYTIVISEFAGDVPKGYHG